MNRIKDYFVNLFLEVRLWLWFRLRFPIKRFKLKHSVVLYPTIYPMEDSWNTAMPWGQVHPDYSHQIMTKESVNEVTINGWLKSYIELKHLPYDKPYTFLDGKREGETVFPTLNAGCIHHKEYFKYGTFELTCILPESNSAWPAFWLTGADTWPPEIDWFEFIPGNMNKQGKYKMSTNIHSGTETKHKQKSYAYRLPDIESGKEVTFSGVWTPKYIAFYYEGILVRKITDQDSVGGMDQDMVLVLGTGGMKDFKPDLYNTKFIIKEVLYEPLDL